MPKPGKPPAFLRISDPSLLPRLYASHLNVWRPRASVGGSSSVDGTTQRRLGSGLTYVLRTARTIFHPRCSLVAAPTLCARYPPGMYTGHTITRATRLSVSFFGGFIYLTVFAPSPAPLFDIVLFGAPRRGQLLKIYTREVGATMSFFSLCPATFQCSTPTIGWGRLRYPRCPHSNIRG